jgi:hypothetical protein
MRKTTLTMNPGIRKTDDCDPAEHTAKINACLVGAAPLHKNDVIEDLRYLSRQRSGTAGLVLAQQSLGRNLMWAGRFASSRSHSGERSFAAELNRHKGRLLLRQGHSTAAEELYRGALSIAREQEAKIWELRGATSLARLWGKQGRRAQARDLLAPVYGWFTEGFHTPDLREAKALLKELG